MNRREFIKSMFAWVAALLFGRQVFSKFEAPPMPKLTFQEYTHSLITACKSEGDSTGGFLLPEEDWIRITKRIDKHQCTPMKWKFAGSIGGRPVYCQVEDKPNFGVKVLDAD